MEYKTCIVCGSTLSGRQTRFCSEDCLKSHKREQIQQKRPPRDHICRCGTCGREMRVGRPRLERDQGDSAFVQVSLTSSSSIQSDGPKQPDAECTEDCADSEADQ